MVGTIWLNTYMNAYMNTYMYVSYRPPPAVSKAVRGSAVGLKKNLLDILA